MGEMCFGCFSQLAKGGVCPQCGYDPGEDTGKYPSALKPGTVLNGKYILGRVLGQGGFGITYAAQDFSTKQRVAIKEFLPTNMASREVTGQVSSFGTQQQNFEHGKEGFMEEANALVDFKANPYIVNVHDFFEANGTAYFVMEYVQGTNLKSYIKVMGGKLGQEEANRILLPIMEALEDVHSKGLVHRDIAPDNIIVTADGSAKLIDFGAARYSTGEKSLSLDVVLKHGYAPKEQYTRRGRQGAYTDVYAMAATYYYAVTGRIPPEAVDRMEEDDLIPPSALGVKLSTEVEYAILKALEVQPADRYQSMGEFARAIRGETEESNIETLPVIESKNTQLTKEPEVVPEPKEEKAPQKVNSNDAKGKESAGKAEVQITLKFDKKAKIVALVLVAVILCVSVYFGIPYFKYKKASNLLASGNYAQAISEFTALGNYSNSSEMVNEATYRQAKALMKESKHSEAYTLLVDLGDYAGAKETRNECIYDWVGLILEKKSSAQAKEFHQIITLTRENYDVVYSMLVEHINSNKEYSYWKDSPYNPRRSTMMYELLQTLPVSYEDTSSLKSLFKFFAAGQYGASNIRKNMSLFETNWEIDFVQDFLSSDSVIAIFLEGYWPTSDDRYYLKFYEEEDGSTWSWQTLPAVSKPSGTEYYDIRDGIYMWIDGNHNELTKVYKFTIIDFNTVKVYCYKNDSTYTVYRQ